jgi:hypothetical protein
MNNLKEALEERLLKAKYIKREGGPGHYKYTYKGSGEKHLSKEDIKEQKNTANRVGTRNKGNGDSDRQYEEDFGSKVMAMRKVAQGVMASEEFKSLPAYVRHGYKNLVDNHFEDKWKRYLKNRLDETYGKDAWRGRVAKVLKLIELTSISTGINWENKLSSLKKALKIRTKNMSEGEMLKAKYLRREGTKGNYKYVYKEKKGRTSGSKETESKKFGVEKRDGTGPYGRGAGPGKGRADGSGLSKKGSGMSGIELASFLGAGKASKEERSSIQNALKAGWRPKNLKEYEKEAIKELTAAEEETKIRGWSDKKVEKEYKEFYSDAGEEGKSDNMSTEDKRKELLEIFTDPDSMDVDDVSFGKYMKMVYGGEENFLKEEKDMVLNAMLMDASEFMQQDKKKDDKFISNPQYPDSQLRSKKMPAKKDKAEKDKKTSITDISDKFKKAGFKDVEVDGNNLLVTNKKGFTVFFKKTDEGTMKALAQGYKTDVEAGECDASDFGTMKDIANGISLKWMKGNDPDGNKW